MNRQTPNSNTHHTDSSPDRDRCIEYVFGSMSDDDQRAFEEQLASRPDLIREVRELRDSTVEVARSLPQVEPPASLREKLMERIAERPDPQPHGQVWQRWLGPNGDRHLVRASGDNWESTDIDGIEVRCLAVDESADRVTMMIRMAPGTRYPKHRHGGVEECYVLSGDLRQAAQVMRAGDYEWCDNESVHGEQWTEEGCTLLVHSSQHDELLA